MKARFLIISKHILFAMTLCAALCLTGCSQNWTTTHEFDESKNLSFSGVSVDINKDARCIDSAAPEYHHSSFLVPSTTGGLNVRIYTYLDGTTSSIDSYFKERSGGLELSSLGNPSVDQCRLVNKKNDEGITYSFYELPDGKFIVLGDDSLSNSGFAIIMWVWSSTGYLSDASDITPGCFFDFTTLKFSPGEVQEDSGKACDEYEELREKEEEEKEKQRDEKQKEEKLKEESLKEERKREEEQSKRDQLLIEEDGKSLYKVQATSSSIHITGSFSGSGNFIIKILDSNQDLHNLACNEIGSYAIDKNVRVTPGLTYYIQIECSSGEWNLQWTGTGGS